MIRWFRTLLGYPDTSDRNLELLEAGVDYINLTVEEMVGVYMHYLAQPDRDSNDRQHRTQIAKAIKHYLQEELADGTQSDVVIDLMRKADWIYDRT